MNNITFNEYQQRAGFFRLPTADEGYVVLGLIGEIGELYGYLAKCTRDEVPMDLTHVVKELGDITWFVSQLCADVGVSFQEVVEKNLDKLQDRANRDMIKGSGDDR